MRNRSVGMAIRARWLLAVLALPPCQPTSSDQGAELAKTTNHECEVSALRMLMPQSYEVVVAT
jgi:hypothetical protein